MALRRPHRYGGNTRDNDLPRLGFDGQQAIFGSAPCLPRSSPQANLLGIFTPSTLFVGLHQHRGAPLLITQPGRSRQDQSAPVFPPSPSRWLPEPLVSDRAIVELSPSRYLMLFLVGCYSQCCRLPIPQAFHSPHRRALSTVTSHRQSLARLREILTLGQHCGARIFQGNMGLGTGKAGNITRAGPGCSDETRISAKSVARLHPAGRPILAFWQMSPILGA